MMRTPDQNPQADDRQRLPSPSDFPLPGGVKGERDDGPRYTPYITLNHDDPVAPLGVFYLSPDIWVTSSRGFNLPKEGEPNQVFARVHNRGLMDAVNVNVRFYWADPSAAITDASVHPIGGSEASATRTGVYIPAPPMPGGDRSVVVACPSPWFPSHLGHECLVVKAWCPGFDLPAPPYEPVLDAVNDRHTAQHNVNVELLAPGARFQTSIAVANISRFAMVARIEVRAIASAQVAATLRRMGVPLRHHVVDTPRSMPLKARLSEDGTLCHQRSSAFARLLLAADAADAVATGPCRLPGASDVVARQTATLAPWEQRQLQLDGQVPRDAQPGQAFGFEVTQWLGDIVTGGYVVLVAVDKVHGKAD